MAFLGNLSKMLSFLNDGIENNRVKDFLKERGLKNSHLKSYEDILSIKPLKKSELSIIQQENPPFSGLVDSSNLQKIYLSPGPIYNAKLCDREHYRFHKALEKAGFSNNDTIFNAFSYNMSPAGEMFDEAGKAIGSTVIPAGPMNSDKAADIISQTFATAFTGTKTFLLNILNHLQNNNTIKKAYLIAEKMTESDREYLLNNYGIHAYQGYGTAEVGLIATECNAKKMHTDTEIFLEVLDPESYEPIEAGETGEAVVTLMNGKLPFVRLATGDLTIAVNNKCDCGSENGYIEGIFGRSDSSVKVKGIFIHYWQFNDFLSEKGIKGRLFVEPDEDSSKDTLKLAATDCEESKIKQAFKEKFGLSLSDVFIYENIDECGIIDNRVHLKEK